MLRLVAFLIGGLLIGTIAGRLLTPGARQTDLAGLPPPPARVERPCGPVSGKTAIIVVHGQSNAANYGSARHTAREAVDNFDPASGKCFAAADPLLGTDGIGGSFATRLGDILIQAGRYDRVIFVPLARGGASLAFLNNEGAELTTNGIAKLKASGADADAYSVSARGNGCGIDDDCRTICFAVASVGEAISRGRFRCAVLSVTQRKMRLCRAEQQHSGGTCRSTIRGR